jgi:hypothetical protein
MKESWTAKKPEWKLPGILNPENEIWLGLREVRLSLRN